MKCDEFTTNFCLFHAFDFVLKWENVGNLKLFTVELAKNKGSGILSLAYK